MKKTALVLLLLAATPALAMAQDVDFPFELNEAIVTGILTIFGVGLMAIVQLVKQGIQKLIPSYETWTATQRHALMYVVTLIIALAATAFTLWQMQLMTTGRMLLYTIYTWGYINQFWKALKDLVKKHA